MANHAGDRPSAMPDPDEERRQSEIRERLRRLRQLLGVRDPITEGHEPERPATYGGVWHDAGRDVIVVATTDMKAIDPAQVTEVAAPYEVRIILVSHSYDELQELRSEILDRFKVAGVRADAPIEWTPDGRVIHVLTPVSAEQLPSLPEAYPQLVRITTEVETGRPRN